MTEVLAYLREQDAADAAKAARADANNRKLWLRVLAILAFAGVFGLGFALAALALGVFHWESTLGTVALVAMFGIWVAGFLIARRIWRSAMQKNDAHPDA